MDAPSGKHHVMARKQHGGQPIPLTDQQYRDLITVQLADWLEQVCANSQPCVQQNSTMVSSRHDTTHEHDTKTKRMNVSCCILCTCLKGTYSVCLLPLHYAVFYAVLVVRVCMIAGLSMHAD